METPKHELYLFYNFSLTDNLAIFFIYFINLEFYGMPIVNNYYKCLMCDTLFLFPLYI